MRTFVTGASGFVGSMVVRELIGTGHEVLGLTRSDAGAAALEATGAEVCRGDVNDLDLLRTTAGRVDGVIHTAFNHDPALMRQSSEADRTVIAALGSGLGRDKPLIVTSGTGLVPSRTPGQPVLETDPHPSSDAVPRAATEEAADALIAAGHRVIVMRLPQVHDTARQGRIGWHIAVAREKGFVAYVDDGLNRVPASHVSDVATLFRLALERGMAGSRYHAVVEEGIPLRDIADAVGNRLGLPVTSITTEQVPEYYGWLAQLATLDLPASGVATREELGWNPAGPDLLSDLRSLVLDAA